MSNVDFTTYEGMFRHTYEDTLVSTVPTFADVQAEMPFKEGKRIGDEYRIPLALQLEAGITWASQADGAFALESPIAGITKQAVLTGSCHLLRSAVAYVAAYAGEDQQQSFENVTGSTVKNAWEGMRRFLEIDCIYGQDDEGIGVVGVVAGGARDPGPGTVAANSVQISLATWGPGLWVEGANIQFFSSTHAALRGTSDITKVDLDNREITVTALPGGTIAGDVVHYKTQFSGAGGSHKTMAGMKKIISATSGTVFSIDVGTFNKWRGNVFDCLSGPLTFPRIGRAMAKVLAKGGQGNKFILWASPEAWTDLNSDIDALRTDDTSGYTPGKVELGHEMITYHSVCGPIEIRAHACVKSSEAFLIPKGAWRRIGSTDITFDRTKMTGLTKTGPGNFLLELSSNAGFEFRAFDHQAIITERPCFCVFFKNIVNNTVL